MSRLRTGEWIAALGAAGLFVTLFLNWFSVDGHAAGWLASAARACGGASGAHLSGWGSLGWFIDVLLCVAIFGGAELVLHDGQAHLAGLADRRRRADLALGSVIFVVLAIRVATQPGLGLGLSNTPVLIEATRLPRAAVCVPDPARRAS